MTSTTLTKVCLPMIRIYCLSLFAVSFAVSTAFAGGVGQAVTDFQLKDYRGKEVALSDFDESELVVLAFMGTECPLAKLYSQRLQALANEFDSGQLSVIAINSNVQDSITEMAAFAQTHNTTYTYLKDPANKVADLVGAERTPEVVLLDHNRVIRYRGRVDDQYIIGVVRDAPQRADLKVAIQELLEGRQVTVSETDPIGCIIGRAATPNADSKVTYSNQISRLFQKHCVECHREGEIAPFAMTSYDDVFGWGEMILEVVEDQRMPPWHADPKHGKFSNERKLTEAEKDLLRAWVRNGSPEGDPQDLPEPQEYVTGWSLPREPDAVFEMREEPFTVAADAGPEGIKYQNFWVKTDFEEDKWVVATEAKPGNRAVVHHIIVYVHPHGRSHKDHSFFVAYVPGLKLSPLPAGAAKRIPAGSWLRFQMHYTPVGTEQVDMSSVGFVFTDPASVTHEVKTMVTGNTDFVLKPHLDDQVVTARTGPSPPNLQLLSMSPHMHLRGKSFRYEARFPDGSTETLLDVPDYDFNWQTQYRLAEPRKFPAGTRLYCTAVFDNSADNPANPDPSETVRWGDQSWEEMMLAYYDVLLPVDPKALESEADMVRKLDVKEIDAQSIIRHADKNNDQQISAEEAADLPLLRKSFQRVDLDRNGQVTEEELTQVLQFLKQRNS